MKPQDDFLSIAEFARIANISPAAVYKRVNNQVDNPLITHVKMINGKKHINRAALGLFNVPAVQPVDNPNIQPVDNQLITILQETLDVLKAELEAKNEQIDDLNARLKESQEIIKASQQIEHERNQLLLLEIQPAAADPEPEQPPATAKSRRWFDWFRKRGDNND